MMNKKTDMPSSKFAFIFIIVLIVGGILIYPQQVLDSSKKGLQLWFNTVFPSLFPFMVGTYLLIELGVVHFIGVLFEPIMRPIFNVSGEGAFPWTMGLISGYPIGAKITSDLRCKGKITQIEAQRLISFTNNSGPLFILGAVSVGMLSKPETGIFLLGIHYLSSLTVGILFRFYKRKKNIKKKKYNRLFRKAIHQLFLTQKNNSKKIGLLLKESILNSMETIVQVGGFIILFSVISELLKLSSLLNWINKILQPFFILIRFNQNMISGFILGIIEITNGINRIGLCSSSIEQELALVSFMIAFGGISIFMQTVSVISHSDINIFVYGFAKLLQGILAFLFSLIFYPQYIKMHPHTKSAFNIFSYTFQDNIWINSRSFFCAMICIIFIIMNIKYYINIKN